MEGPSLVILREEVEFLKGKIITNVSGNTKLDLSTLIGKPIKDFRTFGKHFLIMAGEETVRIHFLMFGSYRINDSKDRPARLSLQLGSDILNFYTCAVALLDNTPDAIYDWTTDVMSPLWDEKKARQKLKKMPDHNVGDALLDQSVFAGVGNIIKSEVLYRARIHPENKLASLPPRVLTTMIAEARKFCFDFYTWKKAFVLRKNCSVYKKKKCKRCLLPVLISLYRKKSTADFLL
jgi:endonuclease VIII